MNEMLLEVLTVPFSLRILRFKKDSFPGLDSMRNQFIRSNRLGIPDRDDPCRPHESRQIQVVHTRTVLHEVNRRIDVGAAVCPHVQVRQIGLISLFHV